MTCFLVPLALALLCPQASAADPSKLPMRLGKEPAYRGSPRYLLLAFGPQAKDLVWLVKDGDTLYVDRDGDGDLTEANEKCSAKKGGWAEEGYHFEVSELNLGGKKHTALKIKASPLERSLVGDFAERADLKAVLKKEPQASVITVAVRVEAPQLSTRGVWMRAGPIDLNGALVPAARAADAPVVHLGGPLRVTLDATLPRLRRGRSTDLYTVVGTPGRGPGTFCAIGYADTIPESARLTAEVVFPPSGEGEKPVRKLYELKDRC